MYTSIMIMKVIYAGKSKYWAATLGMEILSLGSFITGIVQAH